MFNQAKMSLSLFNEIQLRTKLKLRTFIDRYPRPKIIGSYTEKKIVLHNCYLDRV